MIVLRNRIPLEIWVLKPKSTRKFENQNHNVKFLKVKIYEISQSEVAKNI